MAKDIKLLAPAANPGIATYTSADIENGQGRGVKVVVDITAVGGGATLTVTLQGKDPLSGKYYTLLASAALGAAATTVIFIFPGAPVAANVSANDALPATWRVSAALAVANNMTFTIGASILD